MFRKLTTINVGVALIFLLTTVFPASLLSYETVEEPHRENWVDESLDYEAMTYKKGPLPTVRHGILLYTGKGMPAFALGAL